MTGAEGIHPSEEPPLVVEALELLALDRKLSESRPKGPRPPAFSEADGYAALAGFMFVNPATEERFFVHPETQDWANTDGTPIGDYVDTRDWNLVETDERPFAPSTE